MAFIVGSCSDGDESETAPIGAPPAETASTTASSPPPTSSTVTVTDAGSTTTRDVETTPGVDTAATAEITAAFVDFFDGSGTTLDQKVALLQDGERYRSMLEDAAANEQFQGLSADIRDVVLQDDPACAALGVTAPCAVVTHDLLVDGFPMAVAINSPAVRVDGTWLVAAAAWCAVVEIGGDECP